MFAKKISIALLILAGATQAFAADTPAGLIAGYAAEAAKSTPGFAPSATRGQNFFTSEWTVTQKMSNCAACHGKNFKQDGKHVVTDKRIAPFSPKANPERFSDHAKVEKWFKRNCNEVLGRECTPAEKADFIQYVVQGS